MLIGSQCDSSDLVRRTEAGDVGKSAVHWLRVPVVHHDCVGGVLWESVHEERQYRDRLDRRVHRCRCCGIHRW